MHRPFLAGLLLCIAAPLTRAEDSHEKVIEDLQVVLGKLGDTLATIKDPKSAQLASAQVKEFGQAIQSINARAVKLGLATGERKIELEKKYKPAMDLKIKKVSAEFQRILSSIDGGARILNEISETLNPAPKTNNNKGKNPSSTEGSSP